MTQIFQCQNPKCNTISIGQTTCILKVTEQYPPRGHQVFSMFILPDRCPWSVKDESDIKPSWEEVIL